MKLIFAQGNPDAKHARTRHNIGWMMLDALGSSLDVQWRTVDKFKAMVAETTVAGEKVLFIKPQSYYNDTGLVVRQFVDYYKLDPVCDLLVIHDDLSLPFGTIRIRHSGSDAGNNGIKSINSHIGDRYCRLRIGIWTEARDSMDDANFVLGVFPKAEQAIIDSDIIPATAALVQQFVTGTLVSSSMTV
jgi:peptidyl-tRNA hydrolase, PTH1 family